jgi:probable HAF family extracellular repeat protein
MMMVQISLETDMKRVLFAGLLCAVMGVTGLVAAASGSVTNIDMPGVRHITPFSLNDYGEVVGYYELEGMVHGFMFKNGTFTTLDIPPLPNPAGFVYTIITGINNHGDVVGRYVREQEGEERSFIYSRGTFTSLEFPGSRYTIAEGINDLGDVVGVSSQGSFLYSNGKFSLLPSPDVGYYVSAVAVGINNKGQIVGYYSDLDSYQSFIYQDGEFTMIWNSENIPRGINDHGDVTLSGVFSTNSVFLYSKGQLSALHTPGYPLFVGGINNTGEVVGIYGSSDGRHAYVGHLKKGE